MSRNQLRKPTPIVRPASDRASSTLEDPQNPHSEHRWAPPKPVLQNLSRLSNSPIGTTSEPQPSTPNFKSLISEFLGTGKPQTANPSTSAIKFQFKTASSTGGALPPLPDESVFPKDGYEEVEENGQLFAEETEGEEIPKTSSPKPTSSFMDLVPKSPFQSQRNPMPCPSAPKVPRLAVAADRMPSDEISQQVERALKECGFEDGTQKEEQQPPTRKSFTQDIVTGLLNSQSDFFETQMGKGREEVPSAKTKFVELLKLYLNINHAAKTTHHGTLSVEHLEVLECAPRTKLSCCRLFARLLELKRYGLIETGVDERGRIRSVTVKG